MELSNTILREVGNLARAIKTNNDLKYNQLDLHKNQYIFLTRICEHQGISPKALSINLKVDKTTTTKAVQKLISHDYVSKRKDKKDGRKIQLFPTEKALEIYDELIYEENKILEYCFEDFTDNEIRIVQRLIERMNENYKEHWYQVKNYKGNND